MVKSTNPLTPKMKNTIERLSEIECFHYFAKGNSIWYCIHCGYEEEL